jgi:hypothetical protein
MLCGVQPPLTQTRIWLGRIRPGQDEAHQRFVTWLNSTEAHALISRFPLVEYRLDQEGERVKVTMTSTEPTGLVRFLRFDRMWPDIWEFVRADRPTGPAQQVLEPGWEQRAFWRRDAPPPDSAPDSVTDRPMKPRRSPQLPSE